MTASVLVKSVRRCLKRGKGFDHVLIVLLGGLCGAEPTTDVQWDDRVGKDVSQTAIVSDSLGNTHDGRDLFTSVVEEKTTSTNVKAGAEDKILANRLFMEGTPALCAGAVFVSKTKAVFLAEVVSRKNPLNARAGAEVRRRSARRSNPVAISTSQRAITCEAKLVTY